MNSRKIIRYAFGLAGLVLVILFTPYTGVESRETLTQVENYRVGSHPESTRIIIQLNQNAPYRVLTNYPDQKVVVWVRNASLKSKAESIALKDRHLSEIQVQEIKKNVKFILRLKGKNTRLVHFVKHQPEQIVIDLKSKRVSTKQVARKPKQRTAKATKRKSVAVSPAQTTKSRVRVDPELKLKSGRKDYEKALKLFQNKNYREALAAFQQFQRKYRESPFLENTAYMIAETQHNLAKENEYPNYEETLAAYQYAMRTFPDSQFYDHALFKTASIYETMDYTLEARTIYERGAQKDKTSRYTVARQTGLGFMLLKEDKLDEAYKTFQKLLRKAPQNADAKKGLFQIAQRHFEAGDFARATKIYEDVVKRWPDELNEQPEVNFYIGEIYFNQKQYSQARKYYFNLVNLAPETPNAHRGLNRIGDTYLLEKNGMPALTVFNKSTRINLGSAESQYAQIRLADIGIRFPALPVKDLIFEVSPYYHPYRTYEEVAENPQSQDILAEATFSRGSAYYREQRYLQAIEEFKRLLPFEKDSKFHLSAKKYLQLSVVQLIDQYARQNGHLPVLYAYADYLNLDIGELNRVQTQLQIGESYKAIGLNSEALKFFEKVKFADVNGAYTDRLFLDLGEIHLNENRFKEAGARRKNVYQHLQGQSTSAGSQNHSGPRLSR